MPAASDVERPADAVACRDPVSQTGAAGERTAGRVIFTRCDRGENMPKFGLWVTVTGLLTSVAGTLLLFLHTTNEYHASIQDMGSIAFAYLGLTVLGASISVTGVALSLHAAPE